MIYAREARRRSNNSELTPELEREISKICETEIAPKIIAATNRREGYIWYRNKRFCERNFCYAILEYLNNCGYDVDMYDGLLSIEW